MHRFGLLLICVGSLIVSCKDEGAREEKKGDSAKAAPAMKVSGLIAAESAMSDQISSTGSVMANEEVEIRSEIAGKITGIFFKEGGIVSKGQLLVQLNDDDLQAQMRKLAIEIRLQEEKENRQKQLLAATAVSKEEYDNTKTQLDLLLANKEILQTQLDKTRITAPFAGTIGLKTVSPGAFISSNTIITSIQNIQPLKVEFSVPEKYNDAVTNGTVVTFRIAGDEKERTATVFAKETRIDVSTRTTRVRATFPNPGNKILPGAFADVRIPLGQKTKGILIPTIAYIPDINGAKVFLSKGGKAMSVPVTAGIRTDRNIQIIDGIQPGDTVITSGILQLKADMAVEVSVTDQAQ